MGVTLRVKNLDKLAATFDMGLGARPMVRVQVIVQGEASEYAYVWEWGRVTCQPGPKTMWSTNPDGDTVVMTKTAPFGFVRVNRQKYRQFIREELEAIKWYRLSFDQYPAVIEQALARAADRCAALIAATAPYDTYALREAIVAVAVPGGGGAVDSVSVRSRVQQ